MELSSSDKERIQHQYDALAKKTLVGEAAFYSGRQATPEPVQPVTQESSTDDKELLLKLLQNPEMAALLKSLAKTL